MAEAHARALKAREEYELVAVCDTSPESLDLFQERHRAAVYTDVDLLMGGSEPDLVIISTPHSTHAELTEQVAHYRPQAILCEKPMAIDYRDATWMQDCCERMGVLLLVNYQRHLGVQSVDARRSRRAESASCSSLREIARAT